METLQSLLLVCVTLLPVPVLAQGKEATAKTTLPKVEVYEIRKEWRPHTILEISNPTDRTLYLMGSIAFPMQDREVRRGEKWLASEPKGKWVGIVESFPLRPGAKTLVQVTPDVKESASRFRFFFCTGKDYRKGKIFSVRSPAIETKELGDLEGYRDSMEIMSGVEVPKEPEAPLTDEEFVKRWLVGVEKAREQYEEEQRRIAERDAAREARGAETQDRK